MRSNGIVIHTDGASKGNPGHASAAYVITDADHYFRGHEDDVGRMAAKFFTKILGGTDPSE